MCWRLRVEVEKAVNSGEINLDPTDSKAPADQTVVVEKIISVMAKDSATEIIRRMKALHMQDCICVQKNSDILYTFVE